MDTIEVMRHLFSPLLTMAVIATTGWSAAGIDTFGIARFHPTKSGTREWNSAHWGNGTTRTVKYSADPSDPTGWTDDHSGGTDGFWIDGSGTMRMSGSGPRFHINSTLSNKVPSQLFRNTEFTAYFMGKGTGGAAYGGMIVGARSGPLGHASGGGDDCDATTYYARFRNDGKWDFEKELKHPGSTYWSGTGFNKQDPLWGGVKLPRNRWIGMKYLVYDIDAGTHVKLELWIDSVSNGNPRDGGNWQLVGTVVDDGNWPSGDVANCGYAQNMVIAPGHGTFLMRTDGDTAIYKMVSLREIDPPTSTELATGKATESNRLRIVKREGRWEVERGGSAIPSARIDWISPNGASRPTPVRNRLGWAIVHLRTDAPPVLVPMVSIE
jgi:hypothetical protein